MTNPVEPVEIEPGKFRAQAEQMAEAMYKSFGPHIAIGSTASLLEELLVLVLHQETPMVEVNVASIESLLDKLKERVMEHKKCAFHINQIDLKKVGN